MHNVSPIRGERYGIDRLEEVVDDIAVAAVFEQETA